MPRKQPKSKRAAAVAEESEPEEEGVFIVKRIVDSDDLFKMFLIHWDGFERSVLKCV